MTISRVGIISCPMGLANIQPFGSMVKILSYLNSEIQVIAVVDKKIPKNSFPLLHNSSTNIIIHDSGVLPISRVKNYFLTQIRISLKIISNTKIKTWIIYIDNGLFLPIIIAKFLNKKVYVILGGSQELEILAKGCFFGNIAFRLAQINRYLCDNIIIYSSKLIVNWKLKRYEKKIIIAHRHYINYQKFSNNITILKRDLIIGFIGRFTTEKGIKNFVEAIPKIVKIFPNARVIIAGEGPLREFIVEFLQKNELVEKVDLKGWIKHDELPFYLNRLHLLVLPSYTEGLPNIMLEAMACGTPVLATSVGAVTDVIIDGVTGFIMENNLPDCIVNNVTRCVKSSSLNEISINCERFVKDNYSFEKVINIWKNIVIN